MSRDSDISLGSSDVALDDESFFYRQLGLCVQAAELLHGQLELLRRSLRVAARSALVADLVQRSQQLVEGLQGFQGGEGVLGVTAQGSGAVVAMLPVVADDGGAATGSQDGDDPAMAQRQVVAKARIEDIYPLTPIQQGMLFHSIAEPDASPYFNQLVVHFAGELDRDALIQAWQRVVSHHAVLRTAFVWERVSTPFQVVCRSVTLPFREYDWSALSSEDQEQQLQVFLDADHRQGFALSEPPLLRLTLIRRGLAAAWLVWSHHHLLLDGWSLAQLLDELFLLYRGFCRNQAVQLVPSQPFRHYIAWLQNQDIAAAEDFWRRLFAGFDGPPRLFDGWEGRGYVRSGEAPVYGRRLFWLSEQGTEALHGFARAQHLTVNTVIQGAWVLVLSAAGAGEDVVFGSTVASRPASLLGVERMLGLFINTLPVRVRVRPGVRVGLWLQEIQAQQVDMRQFEYSPLVQVQRWSGVPGGGALFESIVVFENYPIAQVGQVVDEDVRVTDVRMVERLSYPLTLAAIPGEVLRLEVHYDARQFAASLVQQVADLVVVLIDGLVQGADLWVVDVPMISPEQRRRLLVDWNATFVEGEVCGCLDGLVAMQVAGRPDAVALVEVEREGVGGGGPFAGMHFVTYQEFDQRACQFGHVLRSYGVVAESVVAVCLERSIALVIGVFGVLKAGGMYVPLDPSYPQERLRFMLADSRAGVVVTRVRERVGLMGVFGESVAGVGAPVVVELDVVWSKLAQQPLSVLARGGEAADGGAYVLFTSGSTGRPKGVCCTHRGVVNLLADFMRRAPLTAADRGSWWTSLGFDVSVYEVFSTLLRGAALYIAPEEIRADASVFLDWLVQHQIAGAYVPPFMVGVLAQRVGSGEVLSLRRLLVGVEPIPERVLAVISGGVPDVRVINGYGPTETTICSTLYGVAGQGVREGPTPIGRPVQNTQVYVLDRWMRLVPRGAPGEVYIGGAGLARGYVGRPDLTADRFVPNPFSAGGGMQNAQAEVVSDAVGGVFRVDWSSRLYRTGDLARYLSNGDLVFVGRVDQQVKVRGYRVELGEVEAVLGEHGWVQQAAVVVRVLVEGHPQLVAFVVVRDDVVVPRDGVSSEVLAFLRTRLPVYMVPALMVVVDRLPLTPSGKLDRDALPVPRVDADGDEVDVAPVSPLERQLAEIWGQLFGVSCVGRHENFFELGGDSIVSIQIASRARQAGIYLTTKDIFEHPTVAGLAAVIGGGPRTQAEQGVVLGAVPLTPIQQWFFAQPHPEPQHFNHGLVVSLHSGVRLVQVARVVEALLRHHDALRLRFTRLPSGWQQWVAPLGGGVPVCQFDLAGLSSDAQVQAVQVATGAAHAGLDLGVGPIVRWVLFTAGDEEPARVLMVVHHLAVDGVSWRILLDDFQTALAQVEVGAEIDLPAKTTSFKQWAEALLQDTMSEARQAELVVWVHQLQVPTRALPVDYRAVVPPTMRSAQTTRRVLDSATTQVLLAGMLQQYGATVEEVTLTAVAQVLGGWCGGAVRVEIEGHGREELARGLDLTRTVGWLTSLYPVVLAVRGADAPRERVREVMARLRTVPRRGIGYGQLRYLRHDGARAELEGLGGAEVVFNYLGQVERVGALVDGEMGGAISDANVLSHRLTINAMVAGGELALAWTWSRAEYAEATIEALADGVIAVLRGLIDEVGGVQQGQLSPADVPMAGLSQGQIDGLLKRLGVEGHQAARVQVEDVYPLSPLQQGLLFHSLLEPDSGLYVEHLTVVVQGVFDQDAFVRAWQELIQRYALFRTAFVWAQLDTPLQVVYRRATLPVMVFDWRGLVPVLQQQRWEEQVQATRAQGFALDVAPLLRLVIARVGDTTHRVLFRFHHILLDGWSVSMVLREVFETYEAFRQRVPLVVEPSRPYRDYIAWLQVQDQAQAEVFWRQALAGFHAPNVLPMVRPVSDVVGDDDRYADVRALIPAVEMEVVQRFVRQAGLTLNSLALGVWSLLLYRYTQQMDVVFGMTTSGRPADLVGCERMVGLFINTIPMRVQVDPGMGVREWLQGVQVRQLELRRYEYASLAKIQSWSEVHGGVSLFETLVIFENYPLAAGGKSQSVSFEDMSLVERTNYPLTLLFLPTSDGLHLHAIYDRSRFDAATISRLLGHVRGLFAAMVVDAGRVLRRVLLLDEAERDVVQGWGEGAGGCRLGIRAEDLVAQQVARTPHAIAVLGPGVQWEYQEFAGRAQQVARYLRGVGVRPGVSVGVCMERSPELLVAMLGIWQAGGVYVPLPPTYPSERLVFMMRDAQVAIVLTQAHVVDVIARCVREYQAEEVGEGGGEGVQVVVRCLDVEWEVIAEAQEVQGGDVVLADQLAYVIYTSGSTGAPKGVAISHANVCPLVDWGRNCLQLTSGDRTLQYLPYNFDWSVWEILVTLTSGATLVVLPAEELLDPRAAVAALMAYEITVLHGTPTQYQLLVAQEQPLPLLRHACLGAEHLSAALFQRTRALVHPDCRIYNMYGPTEATIIATSLDVVTGALGDAPHLYHHLAGVPIGPPVATMRCYVVHADGQLQPIGVPGELWIGGDGLARGYLNRPDLTAERFTPNPFVTSRPRATALRVYRTGDLVRWLPDGTLEYLGRIDQQVKVRGFRIELGEIAHALMQHPDVREAVVDLCDDRAGEKQLVAYVVSRAQVGEQAVQHPESPQLRAFLQEKVPAFMVPALFIALPALPMNQNGKVDRRALPDPMGFRSQVRAGSVAPRNALEQVIAGVWCEALQVDQVGIHDNFFDLGGHSLRMLQVQVRLREALTQEVSLVELFAYPTISALAAHIAQHQSVSFEAVYDRVDRKRQALSHRKLGQKGMRGHE